MTEAQRRYKKSAKGRLAERRYLTSDQGREVRRRAILEGAN